MTAPDGLYTGRVRDAAPYGGVYKKAAVRHPRGGGDGRLAAYAAGIAPSADGALGRLGDLAPCAGRGFRPLRWAGVSLAAASGCFAPCEARPGALPPGPLRFFEKIE